MQFAPPRSRSQILAIFTIAELIFHNTVRNVRMGHGNAIVGLLMNILQTGILVFSFWFMFTQFGMRGIALRGDLVLYLMTGIFVFMLHVKTVKAVFSADGPTSSMMQHAPMNTAISIISSSVSTLYMQILSSGTILYFYHALFVPVTIENWVGAAAVMIMAWLSGIAVGLVFVSLRPWWPEFAQVAQTIWTRINFIASGKMFVANMLSFHMLKIFDWNPLFHLIDQGRGFVFINYVPHKTSVTYPLYVILACLAVGLMAEFFTRRHISISWFAGR